MLLSTIAIIFALGVILTPVENASAEPCNAVAKTCGVTGCIILVKDKITQQTYYPAMKNCVGGDVLKISGECGLRWGATLTGCPAVTGVGGGPRSTSACG